MNLLILVTCILVFIIGTMVIILGISLLSFDNYGLSLLFFMGMVLIIGGIVLIFFIPYISIDEKLASQNRLKSEDKN